MTTQTYEILVNNGFRYEYETAIKAGSVQQARKEWKKRGDWKADDFKVRLVRSVAA